MKLQQNIMSNKILNKEEYQNNQKISDYYSPRIRKVPVRTICRINESGDSSSLMTMTTTPACTKLQDKIDVGNAFEILKFAKLIGDSHLVTEAHSYIIANFEVISKTSIDYLKLEYEDIFSFLHDEKLNESIITGEKVWNAILRWVKYKYEYRKYKMGELVQKIRTRFGVGCILDEQLLGSKSILLQDSDDVVPAPDPNVNERILTAGRTSTELLAIPNSTCSSPGCHSNEVLFTFGGISEDDRLDDSLIVECYDNKTHRWTRIEQREEPRAYHGTIPINHEVAIIGGCCCEASDSLVYLNSCKAFDTISKTWRPLASMHCLRGFVSVAIAGKRIFAMGGVGLSKHVLSSAETYDIESDKWLMIEPMNVKRAQACAASLRDKVYVMGGWNEQEWLSSVEEYDISTNQWTVLARMLNVRAGASCTTYNNSVYVIGGYNGEEVAKSGERYEPESNSWRKIPDMFEPLSEFSMTVFQNKIFCIGGEKCEANAYFLTDDVVAFDAASNQWAKMMRMSVPRHALSACVVKFPCLHGCHS